MSEGPSPSPTEAPRQWSATWQYDHVTAARLRAEINAIAPDLVRARPGSSQTTGLSLDVRLRRLAADSRLAITVTGDGAAAADLITAIGELARGVAHEARAPRGHGLDVP